MPFKTKEEKNKYNKEYRVRNQNYYKKYMKKWKTDHPGYSSNKNIIWKRNNPQKNRAYVKVWHALKTGKLKKSRCVVCNNIKVEAHHKDYNKPLEVIWLCDWCHKQVHTKVLIV